VSLNTYNLRFGAVLGIALLLALAAPAVKAQTIDEVVQQVLDRHPDIESARAAVEAAIAREVMARSARLPRADSSVKYRFAGPVPQLDVNPGIPGIAPFTVDVGSEHNASLLLSASYRIYDFGARDALVAAARQGVNSGKLAVLEAQLALATRVRAVALANLMAREAEAIALASLDAAGERERRMELRFAQGVSSELELVRSRVRVAELEALRVSAGESRRQTRDELAILLTGAAGGDSPEPAGRLADYAAGELTPPLDLEQHPAIQRIHLAQRAYQLKARADELLARPKLDVGASAGAEYPHFVEREWSETYAVGAQITWPFYTGGERLGRVAESTAEARRLDADAARALERLRQQQTAIEARFRNAQAAEDTSRKKLEQAEAYLRAAKAAEEAGTGTDMDVRDAEIAVDAARLEVQRALFDRALARAEWLALAGKLWEGGQ